ncbi:MAG: WS/DGAT domain-containing protein, partial [Polyangia bacterium]
FAYVEDPSFAVDAIFRVVDARDDAALAALIHAEQNRHLDLFADFPVTLTLARTGDDRCRLIFRQHHAIADGRAFIGLLVDFAAFLEAARAGRRPTPEALAPIHRRGELEPLSLTPLRRVGWRLLGYANLVRMIFGALVRPTVPLSQNRSNDYTGDNGTVHWILGDDVLPAWNAARKRIGVSLNSLLTAALFAANQRWHRARGAPLGRTASSLVMETRPRDGGFVSFANHLATLDVVLPLDRLDDPVAMARAIQAQVDRQRRTNRPFKRLLAERALVLGMTVEQMQRIVFESKHPTYNLNFSNLIALDFPTLAGDGWLVDEVLITTPVTPRTGVALTAIRYHGRLVFNFNYKSTAATRPETEALCREFVAVVAELTAQRP